MVTHTPRRLRSGKIFTISVLLSLMGCGSETGKLEIDEFSPPDHFTANGAAWIRHSEITPADERLLNNYFDHEPSVVDNPMIHGEPTLYRAVDSRDRFYWITPVDKEVRWLFIEFRQGRFIKIQEGAGEPFVTAVE